MRKTIKLAIAVGALLGAAVRANAIEVYSRGPLLNDAEREEEFMDWGLGMFVHWSMDSQLGSVISHSMVGASEAYLDRYVNELPKTFNPRNYNPDEWMEIAKLAGVKYMVFTTKHHNGYCMWDTDTTDFNIMNSPYGKDIVKDYVEACRRHGLKVGFYFSPEDFIFQHRNGVDVRRATGHMGDEGGYPELGDYNKKQLDELLGNYGEIDVIFFDGRGMEELTQYVHKKQPRCLVTRGEMETPEQRLPKEPLAGPWESCFTLGNQWQYKPTNESYKSGTDLINMLVETRAKGGNLLINAGPDPLGTIPFEQERRFRELALWMFVNDEAIHDIRPCPVIGEEGVYYTQSKDGKSVYAIMTGFTGDKRWGYGERKTVLLQELRATADTTISVLGQNSKFLEYRKEVDPRSEFRQSEQGLEISVMRAQRLYNNKRWPNAIVVKLENVEFVNASENGSGWVDLLEGSSLSQWKGGTGAPTHSATRIGDLWELKDGVLHLDREKKGRGGYLVTKKSYYDFELRFEFMISYDGNSGVKYRINEKGLGLEYQIIDDEVYRDNKNPTHRTASMYELAAAPDSKTLHPAGKAWNTGRIVAKGNRLEHWLNGEKVVSMEFGSEDWQERFAKSKYRDIPGFAEGAGPILLQDHQDSVSYRNLKIREL